MVCMLFPVKEKPAGLIRSSWIVFLGYINIAFFLLFPHSSLRTTSFPFMAGNCLHRVKVFSFWTLQRVCDPIEMDSAFCGSKLIKIKRLVLWASTCVSAVHLWTGVKARWEVGKFTYWATLWMTTQRKYHCVKWCLLPLYRISAILSCVTCNT